MFDLPPAHPLFDTLKHFESSNEAINRYLSGLVLEGIDDAGLLYEHALDWLVEQRHSPNNFKSHRSELTTFLHWCWKVEGVPVSRVDRRLLNRYVEFCCQPPTGLIGYHNVPQFRAATERVPNPAWRPFLGKVLMGEVQPYRLSASALKTKLALLSAFFSYLNDMEYCDANPAALLLRRGRHKISVAADEGPMKAFTELQWSYVMEAADVAAVQEPERFQRSRFLLALLYGCYLRVSEISTRPGYAPVMGQFQRDVKTGVWGFLVPISKGGKRRTVAVSDALLEALKSYRGYLGLSPLPVANELAPIFGRHRASGKGEGAGSRQVNLGQRQIRELVDEMIELGAQCAERDGLAQDAAEMRTMTVHSLRHTGISHDINLNGRPLSHVQADAGHDSIDTTSQYLHTSRVERHQSAQGKPLDHLAYARKG